MNRFYVGWAVVCWLLCCADGRAAVGGGVLARGKGFSVTQGQVDELVVEQKVMLQSMGRQVTADEERLLEEQTLDRLVIKEVLLQRATPEEQRRGRELVEKRVAEEIVKQGSEEAYRRRILRGGTDPDVFQRRLEEQAIADQVVQREIRSKVVVTEEQVRAFYDEGTDMHARELMEVVAKLGGEDQESSIYRDATNRLAMIQQTNLSRLERPEQARAVMLVLFIKNPVTGQLVAEDIRKSKRERLGRLRQRALAGEDFRALAREFSEEPDAQANNAEYVAVKEKVSMPRLREALFGLPLNEVSEIIDTDLGYYLVQVLERPKAGKVPFEDAKTDVRGLLMNQEVERRLPQWFEQLKKEYEVEKVGG